jgi:hypothetical protein
MDNRTPNNLTPEQAQALAAEYQEHVMKHLFGFLTLTGNAPTTSTSAPFPTDEKETPDSHN